MIMENIHLIDFAAPVDYRRKIKVSGWINKYLALARELK